MIIAELNGKIPAKLRDKEDILTSNVFSFFKYSDRQIFKDYLITLGINITLKESENAEFIFWPSYDDRTEPDLVVVCGKYYLLFEAKFYSDFSPQTERNESQIEREIRMGKMSSKNLNKEFVYIAITAEYYKDRKKYLEYEARDFLFIWTNWQFITKFIERKLENKELTKDKGFASDLFSLLVKKKLRSFEGITNIKICNSIKLYANIFYSTKSSKFTSGFTGFIESLKGFDEVMNYWNIYKKTYFLTLNKLQININSKVFYIW